MKEFVFHSKEELCVSSVSLACALCCARCDGEGSVGGGARSACGCISRTGYRPFLSTIDRNAVPGHGTHPLAHPTSFRFRVHHFPCVSSACAVGSPSVRCAHEDALPSSLPTPNHAFPRRYPLQASFRFAVGSYEVSNMKTSAFTSTPH